MRTKQKTDWAMILIPAVLVTMLLINMVLMVAKVQTGFTDDDRKRLEIAKKENRIVFFWEEL
tara:strand:- start:390 stop:575 length:186 start_codon:yes stop_codon:yes gene_type:complete